MERISDRISMPQGTRRSGGHAVAVILIIQLTGQLPDLRRVLWSTIGAHRKRNVPETYSRALDCAPVSPRRSRWEI